MLSSEYTGTCYSLFTCSLKWTVLTKILLGNCVVTICFCINLVFIFIQTSTNTFYPFAGSCKRWKSKINTLFQNIKRQFKKLAYDIAKYIKINITQNISLVLSSNNHLFLFLNIFIEYLNFWQLQKNLDIMFNPRFKNFSTNGFGNDKTFLPEVLMMMLYKNQIPDLICKIYDDFLIPLNFP